jgi:hypothetical protein
MAENKGGKSLIPPNGGFRNTKTFQLSEVIFDVTVRFGSKFVDRDSRTFDPMVQAARSGRRGSASKRCGVPAWKNSRPGSPTR